MKLYGELASWWPLVSPPGDYAPEAAGYARLIDAACAPSTVLELGSGGGHLASHLASRYRLTLVDRSPDMLRVSEALNPGCEHLEGDMGDLRLDRQFDAVLVQDALMHMTTAEALSACLQTAVAHCRPGGAVLLAPDCVAETYREGVSTGAADEGDRSLRWMEWARDPDPGDTLTEVDFAFLLQEADGPVRVVHDHHTWGLFPRETWLGLCRDAGLEVEVHVVALADDERQEVFVGRRPAG